MKKTICFLAVLTLCLSMALPALAAETGFVPSITYKPGPTIVPARDSDGESHLGIIRDGAGNILSYVDEGCLLITPVASLWDPEAKLSAEVEQLLSFVYEQLNSGRMQLPYEKHEAQLNPADMVIRDLFDVRWGCEEHREMMEQEGVVLEITFDLGITARDRIFVMSYDQEMDSWEPIRGAVNNGDGTVTCTFEHLCAIAFSMPLAAADAPVDDAHRGSILPWATLLTGSAAAAAGILLAKGKKKAAAR